MSDPNPGVNFGGNIENSTIIFGDRNCADTSNKQSPDTVRFDETGACDQLSKAFSADDRRRLRQTLNALPLSVFEDLVFDLAASDSVFSRENTSQPERCRALLSWAESPAGEGLAKVEELLIPMIAEQARISLTYLGCVLEGEISQQTISELQPIIQLLRQITGDDSIAINFVEEGSIRMVLSGSSDGLKKIQEFYASGELENLDIPIIETVQPVDNDTPGARKARLVEVLKLRGTLEVLLARALASTVALARDLASNNDSDLATTVTSILDSNNDSDLATTVTSILDSTVALARDLDSDNDSDRDIDNNLASILDSDNILITLSPENARYIDRISGGNSTFNLARDRARDLADILDRARDRTIARAIALDLDRAIALDRASNNALKAPDLADIIPQLLGLDRTNDHALDRTNDHALDLNDADLRGANLRNINLVGIDFTGADLTGADVQGTVFGDNEGLSESVKRDLEKRGAIFQDSPDSNVPSLVRV